MPNTPAEFKLKVGTKAQVFHGTAQRTKGGLKMADLMKNKNGHIVSKKQHEAGKKALNRLRNLGFVAKKGEFKLFSKANAKKKSASKKKSVSVKKSASPANHKKAHNRSVKGWATRRAKKAAAPAVGGRKNKSSRKDKKSRKNKKNGGASRKDKKDRKD